MQQVHLLISGYVQSVGFRRFVQSHAKKLSLTGWVRNLPDNRVEVLAQGKKEALGKLITLCEKGPFMAEVDSVSVDWARVEDEDVSKDFFLLQTPKVTQF